MDNLTRTKYFTPMMIRLCIGLVITWFGLNQMFNPEQWLIWLPKWALALPDPVMFVFAHGLVEVVCAVCLLGGYFTRISALVMFANILGTAMLLGFNDLGIRDFALSIMVLSVFLHGPDAWCLDRVLSKRRQAHETSAVGVKTTNGPKTKFMIMRAKTPWTSP